MQAYSETELWNLPTELPPSGDLIQRLLYSFFGDRPFSALEIGVHTATKIEIAMRPPLSCARWMGVDPYLGTKADPYTGSYWQDTDEAEQFYQRAKAVFDKHGQPLVRTTSDQFFKRNDERFDLVFVDGDHRRAPARRDMESSLGALREGGIMLVDDYSNPDTADVTRAINEFITHNSDHIARLGHQTFRFQNASKHIPVYKVFVYMQVRGVEPD